MATSKERSHMHILYILNQKWYYIFNRLGHNYIVSNGADPGILKGGGGGGGAVSGSFEGLVPETGGGIANQLPQRLSAERPRGGGGQRI